VVGFIDARAGGTGHAVLVVELNDDAENAEGEAPRTFRCTASQLGSVNNSANMDWEDFEDGMRDGVFRGFEEELGDEEGEGEGEGAVPRRVRRPG
jgi:hypothetical protein